MRKWRVIHHFLWIFSSSSSSNWKSIEAFSEFKRERLDREIGFNGYGYLLSVWVLWEVHGKWKGEPRSDGTPFGERGNWNLMVPLFFLATFSGEI